MDRIAAFGIGSTNFRYVLGTSTGEFLTAIEIEPTRPHELPAQLCEAIETLQGHTTDPIDAVAIGTAGLVDAERGVIEEIDTADGDVVYDLHVREAIHTEFGLPTTLENDCNASVIGEYRYGAGQPYNSVAHVTIGTGIGAGIIEEGRLLRGEHGHAAEVGLISVDSDGDLDSFGVPGAWEAYCSGRGIPRYVRLLLEDEDRHTALTEYEPLRTPDVFEAAANGDRVASDYLDEIARYNAVGLGALINTCNPGIVTLGGGVVLYNQDTFVGRIENHLEEFLFVEPPEIAVTPLGDDIGLYGALGQATYRGDTAAGTRTGPSVASPAVEDED